MVSATLPTSTLSGSMRRYASPARPASHCVSISRSSGLPSLSRVIATLASRTIGGWRLSAWAQRASVRLASTGEIRPSLASHSISRRRTSGPSWRAASDAVAGKALMRRSTLGFEHPQPLRRRQAPASLDALGPVGKRGTLRTAGAGLGQHHGVALARRLEGPDRLGTEGRHDLLEAALVARRAAEEIDR